MPEIDPEDNDNMSEFDEAFNKTKISDPEEEAKHEKALEEDEALVKKQDEKFEEGKTTWEDTVNKFADVPADEFKKYEGADPNPEKGFKDTLLPADSYARGAIAPTRKSVKYITPCKPFHRGRG